MSVCVHGEIMIGIGIDTGGTCTDAVIYDTDKHKVLSANKTLTTKQDLKIGIIKALKGLDAGLIKEAKYISLSTTLATNACVENKGGRAKLVFIGVNPKVVTRMDGVYGLPKIKDIYFLAGDPAKDLKGDNVPDWEGFRRDVAEGFKIYDSVAVVQINPKYNDGEFEKQAEKIIAQELGIPCVRGYDLYQEINVQKRGATALLNARLIPVMNNFFRSIEVSLAELKIDLPIVIVKSDGSVMSKDYALARPVETLLCGPAASVIGAKELCGASQELNALIVDMGGTTSDVALIKKGVPVTADAGICIGEWRTMVKGIAIDTFALGGDTGVKYQNGILSLGERRVIPLCMTATDYPRVLDVLKLLHKRGRAYSYPAHEFFLLINEPKEERLDNFSPKEKELIRALKKGPLSFEEAADTVGANPLVFKMQRLEDEGIIMRSGITPTDVMHVKGDYTDYNEEASMYGLKYLCYVTGKDYDEVCDEIYDMAKERLYGNLVKIFLKHEMKTDLDQADATALRKMTDYIYKMEKGNVGPARGYEGEVARPKERTSGRFITPSFATDSTLIGIGAPTKIFLKDIVDIMQTDGVYPEFAGVANAIGAAVGNVRAEYTVRIEPDAQLHPKYDYLITGGEGIIGTNNYKTALDKATEIATQRAIERARAQGATGELKIDVTYDEEKFKINGYGKSIFVGNRVTATAVPAIKEGQIDK